MEKSPVWSNWGYIWPAKMKKMIKNMRKSYEKADRISQEMKEQKKIEEIEAENYLEEKLNLNK